MSDGSRVEHGSPKHIKDLETRIKSLTGWRDKQKKGSEARANYARVINRLKSELASAKRAKAKKLGEGRENPDPEQLESWEKVERGETPDEFVKRVVSAFQQARSINELDKAMAALAHKKSTDEVSTVLSDDFVSWLYDRCAQRLGGAVKRLR